MDISNLIKFDENKVEYSNFKLAYFILELVSCLLHVSGGKSQTWFFFRTTHFLFPKSLKYTCFKTNSQNTPDFYDYEKSGASNPISQ